MTGHPKVTDGMLAYKRGDFGAALRILVPYAEQGHPEAQGVLGVMYQNGLGAAQDMEVAADWFSRAAAKGDRQAAYNLDILQKCTSLGPLLINISASDFSALEAGLKNPGRPICAAKDSANDFLWSKMEHIGWASRLFEKAGSGDDQASLRLRNFIFTEDGRKAMQRLLPAFHKKRHLNAKDQVSVLSPFAAGIAAALKRWLRIGA